ncbi:MAG: hypothetical protein Q8L87_16740 [Anaerolineales bacterium]|nr:hypothetical protein [Anaerolineales bacterium]
MEEKTNKFEWTILIIFIISALGIIYYRINTPASEVNQLTTVLLSTFEVLLSLYVGYFLQRLDSIKRSRESLKKYGFLAYRRIMDIKKSINRLFNEIARINKYLPDDKATEVKVLHSILEGTFDTVESSVLDWLDIIGEEIKKKEKIEKLEEELTAGKSQVNLSDSDKKNLEEIKGQLEKLRAEIPLALKIDDRIKEDRQVAYLDTILGGAKSDGSITLYAKISLEIPLSAEDERSIREGSPFLLKPSYRSMNLFLDVYSKDMRRIGFVVPSIEYDRETRKLDGIPNAFIRENENDGRMNFVLALDNLYAFDTIENTDGFCVPSKCDFDDFVDTEYFRITFLSALWPTG